MTNSNNCQNLKRRLRSSTISFLSSTYQLKKLAKLLIVFFKERNNVLSTILFTKDNISKILRSLNPNKAHGYYLISNRKLKIRGDPLLKALELIFNHALKVENFTPNGKKKTQSHFIKNDKELIENYHFILLLLVCGKVVERLIYVKMFKFSQKRD